MVGKPQMRRCADVSRRMEMRLSVNSSRWVASLTLLLAGLAATPTASSDDPAPVQNRLPRAAIEEFDWATVSTSVQALFGTHVDIGKGVRSLLTRRLHDAGRMRLIDGSASGLVNPTQPAPAADVYLRGDIVVFGRDDRARRMVLGQAGLLVPFGGVRLSGKEHKAVVTIAYRVVGAGTLEILDAGEATGESTRGSVSVGGLFGRRGGIGAGAVDMESHNFAETLIGEAVVAATDRMASAMNETVSTLPVRPRP
jgi:curli biogenesis system outer membrane secretion channel CsgG